MCCKHCCNVEPIEVGTIVHEMNIFRGTVRTNGALTITVEYLGPEVAVISYSSKGRGNFHSEASVTREEFDSKYERCNCPSEGNCKP